MKKILLTLLLVSSALANNADIATKKIKISISQVVQHPALDATVKGIIDALDAAGYKKDQNLELRTESAQANAALAGQIASKFINQQVDVVIGVGTVSAQAFAKYAKDGKAKLIFSSVTEPVSAGLVTSLETPTNNISGVSNFVALEPQLELFKKLQPTLKKLGVIYNPGEINSVAIITRLETICPTMGITLIKQSATKTADIAQAAVKLAQSVDAIFISNDNTALSALQSIIKTATSAKIPVYVSDTDAVSLGALAALGPNQYEIGQQTGRMIVRALQKKSLHNMPIEFPTKTDLYINMECAKKLGISLPQEILDRAIQIFPTTEGLL